MQTSLHEFIPRSGRCMKLCFSSARCCRARCAHSSWYVMIIFDWRSLSSIAFSKPCGLPYFSRMFHRGVAVCTGSGIGAVASTCIQHEDWFLIWIGPDLEKTYGRPLLDLIERTIPPQRRLIWDTRTSLGRPDVFALLSKTYERWDAEGKSLNDPLCPPVSWLVESRLSADELLQRVVIFTKKKK